MDGTFDVSLREKWGDCNTRDIENHVLEFGLKEEDHHKDTPLRKKRLSYPFVEISINSGIPVNLSKPTYKNCRITVALRKMRTFDNPRIARVVTSVHLIQFDQFPVSKFLCR